MEIVLTLLSFDLLEIKSWFRTQTLGKVFVSGLFLILVFFLSLAIFFSSQFFFQSLKEGGKYGLLTAQYLLHSGIVLFFYFSFVSNLFSTVNFSIFGNKKLEFLLSQPISFFQLFSWIFCKCFLSNFFFIFPFFAPLIISYGLKFSPEILKEFFFRSIFLFGLLNFLTQSLAIIFVFPLSYLLKKGGAFFLGIIFFLFLFLFLGILHLIFPPYLSQLYTSSFSEFFHIYQKLPLNNPFLPSFLLTENLLFGWKKNILFFLALTFFFLFTGFFLQKKYFLTLWQKDNFSPKNDFFSYFLIFFPKKSFSFLYKEYLAIKRNPSELGYLSFLLVLGSFFYFLLLRFKKTQPFTFLWPDFFLLGVFSWTQLLNTAFFLRFVYPLMASEGPNAWLCFTFPLKRERLLFLKKLFSLFLALPAAFFTVLAFFFLPSFFSFPQRAFFLEIVFFTTFFLSLNLNFLGAVKPNFGEGGNPEKVSTSNMGMLTLFVALLTIALPGYLLENFSAGKGNFFSSSFVFFSLEMILSFILYLIARLSLKSYNF